MMDREQRDFNLMTLGGFSMSDYNEQIKNCTPAIPEGWTLQTPETALECIFDYEMYDGVYAISLEDEPVIFESWKRGVTDLRILSVDTVYHVVKDTSSTIFVAKLRTQED